MSAYPVKNLLKSGAVIVGASVSAQVLGETGLTGEGARSLRVNLKASDVTVTTGITVRLQQLIAGTFSNLASANSSVALTADGVYSIKMDIAKSADQVDMPLSKQLRVVITTGTGDAATIEVLDLLQAS